MLHLIKFFYLLYTNIGKKIIINNIDDILLDQLSGYFICYKYMKKKKKKLQLII